MASEKWSNLGESTLSGSYTSGGASISVTSASGFPTVGVFRVRLDNVNKTIYRVDSVSGTTFTGGAEANDGNATAGAAVVQVLSRQSLERLLQSPESGEVRARSGSSAADFYGPIAKLGDPTGLAWSWVNQGGATIADANGISYLTAPSSTTSVRSRVMTAPATPYTITGLFRGRYIVAVTTATQYGGLVFRESSTSKLYIWYVAANGALVSVKFTNDTTFGSVGPVNVALTGAGGNWHWLRVTDDGTSLRFAASVDGVNFKEYGTEGRTVHMAGGPNQVGFFANVDSSAGEMSIALASWIQT